ncbi:hypothetical protein L596_005609 [Steinernema carpocapsae]|uniref:Microtubule-associated protein 9 n=1 Tax=Steinernema carpocapsae TaxID=34508 RepID=A0A4U8V3M3_STECR|nr:hypothetical protein L596_005609 [Steinernema carpocapsae]
MVSNPSANGVTLNVNYNQTFERPSTRHGRPDVSSPPKEHSPMPPASTSGDLDVVDRWSRSDDQSTEEEQNLQRGIVNRSLVPSIKHNTTMHAVHRNRRGSLTTTSSRGSIDSSTAENKKIKIPSLEVNKIQQKRPASKDAEKRSTYRKSASAKERPKSSKRQNSLPPSRMSDFVTGSTMNAEGSRAHKSWLNAKLRERKELQKKLKEKEEDEKRKLEERKEDAKRSFEAWKHKQDEKLREHVRKLKQEEDDKRKKQKEEKLRKHEEAGKVFEAWKKSRSMSHAEEKAKEEEKKRRQLEKKEREEANRRLENDDAIEAWLDNKRINDEITKKLKETEIEEKEKKEKDEKEYKDVLATEAYNVWLEMKDKERDFSKSVANRILTYEEEAKKRWPTPWLPPSNSVPRSFVASGNRRKSLDPRKPLRHSRPPTRAPRSTSVH